MQQNVETIIECSCSVVAVLAYINIYIYIYTYIDRYECCKVWISMKCFTVDPIENSRVSLLSTVYSLFGGLIH